MTSLRSAALAALMLAALPSLAYAHNGVDHEGCPTGQTFTLGDLSVTGAFTRATPPGAKSAGGYLTITNNGSAADIFTGATSQAATDISIHSMKMNGQVMEMAPVHGGLEVPAGGKVSLDPMGYHLMLIGMEQPFDKGECIVMTLHFAKAGDMPIELNVGSFAQKEPPTDSGDMSGVDMSSMSSMEGM